MSVYADIDLHAAVGGLAESVHGLDMAVRRQEAWRWRLAQNIAYIGLIPWGSIAAASTTLDVPNIMGPRTGQAWDFHRITCTGFSAGAVNIYLDAATTGNEVLIFSAAAVTLVGKAQILVESGHRILAQSNSSFSGTAVLSCSVTQVSQEYLADYLL